MKEGNNSPFAATNRRNNSQSPQQAYGENGTSRGRGRYYNERRPRGPRIPRNGGRLYIPPGRVEVNTRARALYDKKDNPVPDYNDINVVRTMLLEHMEGHELPEDLLPPGVKVFPPNPENPCGLPDLPALSISDETGSQEVVQSETSSMYVTAEEGDLHVDVMKSEDSSVSFLTAECGDLRIEDLEDDEETLNTAEDEGGKETKISAIGVESTEEGAEKPSDGEKEAGPASEGTSGFVEKCNSKLYSLLNEVDRFKWGFNWKK